MLLPVRADDPNRNQKEYYRRKREERCAYQRAYEDCKRGAPARLQGAWRFVSAQQPVGSPRASTHAVTGADRGPDACL